MVDYDSLVEPGSEISVTGVPDDVFNASPRTENYVATNPDGSVTLTITLGPTDLKELMGLNFNGENIDSIEVVAVADTPEGPESTPEVNSCFFHLPFDLCCH